MWGGGSEAASWEDSEEVVRLAPGSGVGVDGWGLAECILSVDDDSICLSICLSVSLALCFSCMVAALYCGGVRGG